MRILLTLALFAPVCAAQVAKPLPVPRCPDNTPVANQTCEGHWGYPQTAFPMPPMHALIHGVPDSGKDFWMPMQDDDSVGSIYKCMDKIHRRHWFWHRTGWCEIPAHSIRAGKHDKLEPKYPGIYVRVNNKGGP